jgi:hypothetical protein
MVNRMDDPERRSRDFVWWNRDWDRNMNPDWEQRLHPTRSYPLGHERDPYRNFNRGMGDDRQWDRVDYRGRRYDQDWDWDRGFYRGQGYDRDWQRGGYDRDFDRGWEEDVTDDFDWEPETVWTYQETCTAGRVQLNVPADQVENLAWRAMEGVETPAPREGQR